MALFFECMPSCPRKTLDTADIVRDGDFSPVIEVASRFYDLSLGFHRKSHRLSSAMRLKKHRSPLAQLRYNQFSADTPHSGQVRLVG